MFCKNCGAQIPENAKFCPKCGVETQPDANQQSEEYQKTDYNQEQLNYLEKYRNRPSIIARVLLIVTWFFIIMAIEGLIDYDDGLLLEGGVYGLILSILSILFALVSIKRGNKKFIMLGVCLVLAAVALIISIRSLVVAVHIEQTYSQIYNYYQYFN